MTIKKIVAIVLTTAAFLAVSKNGFSQKVSVKTNLLYDASMTANLGVEVGFSNNWSIDMSVSYNGWNLENDNKTKQLTIQPEVRWWFRERFSGHFIGGHVMFAQYNMAGTLPFGIKPSFIKDKRFQGGLLGIGFSYGYQWTLTSRLSVETTIGFGYSYVKYEKYGISVCSTLIESGIKHYIGPTKIGVTLIYYIK